MNMYREEWIGLDKLRRQDVPALLRVVEKLVEQRDQSVWDTCCPNKEAAKGVTKMFDAALVRAFHSSVSENIRGVVRVDVERKDE